jgi:hypothetical protein
MFSLAVQSYNNFAHSFMWHPLLCTFVFRRDVASHPNPKGGPGAGYLSSGPLTCLAGVLTPLLSDLPVVRVPKPLHHVKAVPQEEV